MWSFTCLLWFYVYCICREHLLATQEKSIMCYVYSTIGLLILSCLLGSTNIILYKQSFSRKKCVSVLIFKNIPHVACLDFRGQVSQCCYLKMSVPLLF